MVLKIRERNATPIPYLAVLGSDDRHWPKTVKPVRAQRPVSTSHLITGLCCWRGHSAQGVIGSSQPITRRPCPPMKGSVTAAPCRPRLRQPNSAKATGIEGLPIPIIASRPSVGARRPALLRHAALPFPGPKPRPSPPHFARFSIPHACSAKGRPARAEDLLRHPVGRLSSPLVAPRGSCDTKNADRFRTLHPVTTYWLTGTACRRIAASAHRQRRRNRQFSTTALRMS